MTRYPVTPAQAMRRGHATVNVPVMLIMGSPLLGVWLLPGVPPWLWLPAFPLAFVAGWGWWSWSLPRWRVWALEHVEDLDALMQQAIAEKLIWPLGHPLEKTEIKPAALRAREEAIIARRRQELRDAGMRGSRAGA